MLDEKWNAFMSTGKITDYLDYKGVFIPKQHENGEENGNNNAQGNSYPGISFR